MIGHKKIVYRRIAQYVGILFVLALSVYLRLYKISEYMTYLGDEGRDALIVKRMIVDGKFTLLGPTASVGGFFLGPIYYYFMAPFLWLWKLDPAGPAVMVALFGIATVYLVYRITREFSGYWAGIIASSLYALSPVIIAYTRSSWNPNLVPFFSVLLLYFLWHSATQLIWWHFFVIGAILGIGLQLHYLFIFLFVVTGIWLSIQKNIRTNLLYVSLLVIGFIIGYGPFLLFELRHGFPNTHSIIQFMLTGKDTGYQLSIFIGNISSVVYRLFGRLVMRLPDEGILLQQAVWVQAVWRSSITVSVLVSFGYIFYKLCIQIKNHTSYRNWTDKNRFVLLVFLWVGIVLFLFGVYKRAIYDYYLGIIFVIPFILVGTILSKCMRRTYSRYIAIAVYIFLLYFNWQGRPFLYPPNNQYAQMKKIAQAAIEKTDNKPYNFALVANYNSDHAYRFFFEIWNHPPITIEPTSSDPNRNTVTDQLIVICEIECKPLGHPLWEIAGFGQAEIAGDWDVPFVKIYKLIHYKENQKSL